MAESKSSTQSTSVDLNAYDSKLNEAYAGFHGGDVSAIVSVCEQLMSLDSRRPEAFAFLGLVAYTMDDAGRAVQMYETAHDLDPDCRDYTEILATLYARIGKLTDGVYFAKLSTTLENDPRFEKIVPTALKDFASALLHSSKSVYHLYALRAYNERNFREAADMSRRHLQIERNDKDAYLLLARSCVKIGIYEQAVSALHTAIHLCPTEALNYVYLGKALIGLAQKDEALACFKRARACAPHDPEVHVLIMDGLVSLSDDSWPRFRKIAGAWNRKHTTPRHKALGHKFDPAEGRRIRVGYMASSFNLASPDAYFINAVLEAHDRARFELIGYQTFAVDDPFTHKMQNACDVWVKLKDIDTYTASLIVKNDQCDILVDCTGYQEEGRADVMAGRNAPVQVSWVMGGEGAAVPGMDFLISDNALSEADEKMCLKEQRPLILEHGSLALAPFNVVEEASAGPAKQNGFVTFGAIADLTMISMDCIALWCKILQEVSSSRIAFGYVDEVASEVKERIVELFSHMGMADRIVFHEPDEVSETGPGLTEYRQEFFSLVDVLLDGHPISKPLAVAQSLWMGVPVVCLSNGRRSARMGASVLASAKQNSWIARSEDEYVQIIKFLTTDFNTLEEIRLSLRENVQKTPLFDPASLARRMENAFLSVLNK